MRIYLAFDYFYRDAGNYKSFSTVWLSGTLSAAQKDELIACLECAEFFVAEQVGVPALYQELFDLSAGPTEDDHLWHTFEGFREENALPQGSSIRGTASDLLEAFRSAKRSWQPELSPNFGW